MTIRSYLSRSKNLFFGILLAVIVFSGVSARYFLLQRPNNTSTNSVSMATELERLRLELVSATRYEWENGCVVPVPEHHNQLEFCGDSKERLDRLEKEYKEKLLEVTMPSREQFLTATERIRKLVDKPDLVLNFAGSGKNPYTDLEKMDFYEDNRGMYYWVNQVTNDVIQFGSISANTVSNKQPLYTAEQLQEIAEKFLSVGIPDFQSLKDSYQLSKDCDDLSCGFTWKRSTPFKNTDSLVSVTVTFGGDISLFMDRRSLYPDEE